MQYQKTQWTQAGFFVIAACAVLIVLISSAVLNSINDRPRSQINFDAEVLVLGNSQLLGVIGESTADRVHNAAVAGSDYSIQYAILKGLVARMPRLKLLVIGFDNIPLRTPAISNMNGDFRKVVVQGVQWMDIPEISLGEKLQYLFRHNRLLEPLVFGPKLDLDRIESLLTSANTGSTTEIAETDFEFLPAEAVRPGFEYSPSEGREKMQSYFSNLETNSHLDANRRAFMEIVRLCHVHDIRVILVITPTTQQFRNARSAQWNQELSRIYWESEAKYPETAMPVWDINESETYPVSLFMDPNHLTSAGLQRYNRELDAVLIEQLD